MIDVIVPRTAVAKSHAPRRTPKPIDVQKKPLFAFLNFPSSPCAVRNWKPANMRKMEATGMPTLTARSNVALINFGMVFIPQSGPPPTIKPYDSVLAAKTRIGTREKKAKIKRYFPTSADESEHLVYNKVMKKS